MTSSTFKIVPAHKSDIPALIRLDFDAYAKDALHKIIHPYPPTQAMIDAKCKFMLDDWCKPYEYIYNAVDTTTGEIVASIEWEFITEQHDWTWKEGRIAPGYNKERLQAIQKMHAKQIGEVMGGRMFMFLTSLSTVPSHQRRGLATLLLRFAISTAAAVNLPIFLTASPSGAPVYRRNGFQPHSTFTIDLPGVLHQTDPFLLHPAPLPTDEKSPQIPSPLTRIVVSETADPADYAHCVRLEDVAMKGDVLTDIIFQPPKDVDASRKARVDLYTKAGLGEGKHRLTLARDELTGEVVGVGRWHFLDGADPAAREDPLFDSNKWSEGTVKEMANALFQRLYEARMRAMKGRKYIYMHVLMIEPSWQRLGVGQRILKWGLDQADERGLPCWVDSTKIGEGLYKKMGFVEKGTIDVDEGEYGVKGRIHSNVYLLREPRVADRGN